MIQKRWAALLSALVVIVAAGLFAGSTASTSAAAPRTYPVHTGIVSTTFWVGEIFNASAADGSQVCSTYDSQWAKRWSGKDNGTTAGAGTDCAGAPMGGCDGKPSGAGNSFQCATEPRTAQNGYFPTDPSVTPKENPFYLDLPFDDVNNSAAYASRGSTVPWAGDAGYVGNAANQGFSYMKNRWVKLSRNGSVCYGQVQDAGPGQYDDQAYVFGANDARPSSKDFGGAGMDVSPALTGCLGFSDVDGITGGVNWSFVENTDVPAGPWTRVVTTSQIEGAVPSAAYANSSRPPQSPDLLGGGLNNRGDLIALRARVNSRYVTAENAGRAPLFANRTAVGPWERLDLVRRGGSTVALRAEVNNRYVTAESAGSSPLIANRTAVGPWELFTLISNPDGTISLRAQINGKLVTADGAGARALIANRTAIGLWEKFDLIHR